MLGIEIHREYNKKSHELLDAYDEAYAHQQKVMEGRKAGQPLTKEQVNAAKSAAQALDKVLQHMAQPVEVVRTYRLVSTNEDNRVVREFVEEAASAESEAKKIAMSEPLHKFDVLEKQEDGRWLSIWIR